MKNMKKKIFAVLIALSLAASLMACGSSSSSASDEGGIKTVSSGVLTCATSPDFAPYEFYAIASDGTPTLAGFDVALAGYIADYMGLTLEMVTVDFDGVLSELQTKSVDIGLAGLSPSPEREAIMDFSDIYYQGGQALICHKDNVDSITSFDDVNSPEYTIGVQTGSIQVGLAETNTPDATIVLMPKVTDIVSEILSGKEDAAYVEWDVALSYQKNYPDLAIALEVPYEIEGSAVGVVKDNPELLAAVNEAIAAALDDGSMAQFVADAQELASGETYEGLLED